MPRTTLHPKESSFNLRIDPALKAAFTAATEAEDKPAAQVLREFMRAYVERRNRRNFAAVASRQSLALAAIAHDPNSEEHAILRELESDLDADNFASEWKA